MNIQAGEICAILAALFGAGAVCFFKKSGESIPPLSLNLLRNLVAVALVSLTIPVISDSGPMASTFMDFALLIGSGLLVMAVGDTMFFAALNRLGMGMWAIVSCFYSPTVILMAYLALDEKLGLMDIIGATIIVVAIAFCAVKEEGKGALRRGRLAGVALGVGSLVSTALGVIIMKPALARVPLIWSMEIRLIGATVGLLAVALISRNRRLIFAALRPAKSWKYMLPGAALGSYIAGGFWTAGFKYTAVSGAAILGQLSILFLAAFARIFLKEPLTLSRALKLGVSLVGAILVAIF